MSENVRVEARLLQDEPGAMAAVERLRAAAKPHYLMGALGIRGPEGAAPEAFAMLTPSREDLEAMTDEQKLTLATQAATIAMTLLFTSCASPTEAADHMGAVMRAALRMRDQGVAMVQERRRDAN